MLKKLLCLLVPVSVYAQTDIPLNDLRSFQNPSATWTIEGQALGTPDGEALTVSPGKGVLVNTLKGQKYQRTDDLVFGFAHEDIRLSLDYMIPKGSNSGIYLQSRYEIQILDSWLKVSPTDGDAGAIYHRWDESRGTGKEGYEGHAPRQNAVKAPGLWNHLEIDFKAPRFDAKGNKIANARIVKISLNGVLIHENIELLGVTRGAVSTQEVAKAPLMIQGDHGQVAFKNIKYEIFDKAPVTYSPAKYAFYKGKFGNLQAGSSTPAQTGTVAQPSVKVSEVKADFLLQFEGKLTIPETDTYTFITNWTGSGALLIDGDTLTKGNHWYSEDIIASRKLTAGEHPYKLLYAKDFGWGPRGLGLFVERSGAERTAITERTSLPEPEATPLVEIKVTDDTKWQRSFTMYKGRKKTHVIHVGMPGGLNYSYNLNQGSFLHAWRGKFLDATLMWHDRGEPQLGAPMGVVVVQNNMFPLALLPDANATFSDSLGTQDLQYKGYVLQKTGTTTFPVFQYNYKGLKVKDTAIPQANNQGIVRKITVEGTNANLYALVAEGEAIVSLGNERYGIDNQQYYVEILGNQKAFIRDNKGKKQLVVALNNASAISYQITF